VAAYSLPRGLSHDRNRLRTTLFDAGYAERYGTLATRIEQLEAKLRAIEEDPAIDDAAVRAATTHARLLCSASGYVLVDVDAPPPAPGTRVEHDGVHYTVWRLGPSPLPDDRRRCAVLIPDA
jgi:hypothetical protein